MTADPTARALLVLSLLSSRRTWLGGELAERLGVTDRTLRRDIDRLRLLGYRIDGTAGTGGGYQLQAGANLPPLFLDDDEAVAITAALIAATGERSTGMVDSSTRALAKLNHVLPPALFRRVAAIQGATRTVSDVGAPDVDPAAVATLAEASRDRVSVRFAYTTRDGRKAERRVDPHSLVTPGKVWYLVGYDLDRQDWRVFRVDRASDVTPTGHGAVDRPLPGGNAGAFVARAIARTPLAYAAVVHVPMDKPALQRARPGLLRERIQANGDETCTVNLASSSLDDLLTEIGRLVRVSAGCRLEADAEVLDRVAETAGRLRDLVPQ